MFIHLVILSIVLTKPEINEADIAIKGSKKAEFIKKFEEDHSHNGLKLINKNDCSIAECSKPNVIVYEVITVSSTINTTPYELSEDDKQFIVD